MRTYFQGLTINAIGKVDTQLGSFAVIILDGRKSHDNLINDCHELFQKRSTINHWYGFRLKRGCMRDEGETLYEWVE